jgi:sterol desaturase/sphingolipid hydroxylase (fatty acid hydroxylase superfamily)
MDLSAEFIRITQHSYVGWIIVLVSLTAFEIVNSREKQPVRNRVNGIAFWALSIPLSAAMLVLWSHVWSAFGLRPLLTLPIFDSLKSIGLIAGVIAGIVGAVVNDFFFYWFHRAQHRWLWRYHAAHHSIRELNAVNSYHHASEALVALALHTIPASLVISIDGDALPLVTAALWLHIVWIHSPTRFNLGPLRAAFVDNRFHRIHHSLEERHFDKNFGAFTTLWDRLFGTVYFPEPEEWPDVGLADMPEPRGLREWFDLPLRYGKISDPPVSAALFANANEAMLAEDRIA